MNGKAIIGQCTDTPRPLEDATLRYSFQVSFFGTAGLVSSEIIDVQFEATDTVAQIKTKVRNVMIARGVELGLVIATNDVGSIMQI